MADRVAIIGGKTSGWDHFPFPVPEVGGVGGLGTVYPFDAGTISIAEWCLAYYRVKQWQIDVDITRSVSMTPPYHSVGTFYANAGELVFTSGAPTSDPFTRESDLVVPRGITATDGITTSNFAMFCSQDEYDRGTLASLPEGRIARLVGEFSAMLVIECEVSGGPSTVVDPTHHAAAILHFLGQDYQLYSNDADWSGDITISPSEYWPYATKAGLPVYDTSTGAQLRDPFS